MIATVYREIFVPVFAPFALTVSEQIYEWASQIISFKKQLCPGKFKFGQNRLQGKKCEKNTGQNIPVYSIYLQFKERYWLFYKT